MVDKFLARDFDAEEHALREHGMIAIQRSTTWPRSAWSSMKPIVEL